MEIKGHAGMHISKLREHMGTFPVMGLSATEASLSTDSSPILRQCFI